MITLFTIGHSRHTAGQFVALLRAHAIEQLVDVRSQPHSKWAPHFDKADLARCLGDQRIEYAFMGRQLGGRPNSREFYRLDGTVDYARRALAPDFVEAIGSLISRLQCRQTVILCAEEDPTRCHRRLLVAPALARAKVAVVHVRGDGRLEPEPDTAAAATQLALFGERT
jgi:uncharacterized protein (DUF488 family)